MLSVRVGICCYANNNTWITARADTHTYNYLYMLYVMCGRVHASASVCACVNAHTLLPTRTGNYHTRSDHPPNPPPPTHIRHVLDRKFDRVVGTSVKSTDPKPDALLWCSLSFSLALPLGTAAQFIEPRRIDTSYPGFATRVQECKRKHGKRTREN